MQAVSFFFSKTFQAWQGSALKKQVLQKHEKRGTTYQLMINCSVLGLWLRPRSRTSERSAQPVPSCCYCCHTETSDITQTCAFYTHIMCSSYHIMCSSYVQQYTLEHSYTRTYLVPGTWYVPYVRKCFGNPLQSIIHKEWGLCELASNFNFASLRAPGYIPGYAIWYLRARHIYHACWKTYRCARNLSPNDELRRTHATRSRLPQEKAK